jgi:hypothetical protein
MRGERRGQQGTASRAKLFPVGADWRSDMPYAPKDPLTDPPRQPDELRRLNLEQDNSGAAMRPWIVAGIAAIIVVMLVYGYTAPMSTTAIVPPFRSSPTTTGAAPATPPTVNPLAATPSPAPSAPASDNH